MYTCAFMCGVRARTTDHSASKLLKDIFIAMSIVLFCTVYGKSDLCPLIDVRIDLKL